MECIIRSIKGLSIQHPCTIFKMFVYSQANKKFYQKTVGKKPTLQNVQLLLKWHPVRAGIKTEK